MKRYAEYKDSGIEWIGEIPSEWSRTKLKNLLEMPITDGPHETPQILDEGIPFLSAEAVKNLKLDFNLKRGYISRQNHKQFCEKCKPRYGDIFMIKSGATTGNIAMVETHEEFSIWSPLALIRSNDNLMFNRYLFYFLQSKPFKTQVELFWSYGTQQNIGMGVLGNLYLSYPYYAEQEQIVVYLDRKTAAIDELIADKQKLVNLLKEKRNAIISEAVTKGLDKTAKMKDSGVEWIGEIPNNWNISRIGFETWVRARLGWKGLKADEYVDVGYAFLSTPNIKNAQIDFENVNFISKERYDESPEIKVSVGDVLLAKDGSTLGTVNVVRTLPRETTVNSSIAVITPGARVDSIYLFYLFQSVYIKNTIQMKKGGMGVSHLFQGDIVKFSIPSPIIEEQKAIALYLDQKTSQIDSLISDINEQIEKLKEYRQAIISEAVTGKVAV